METVSKLINLLGEGLFPLELTNGTLKERHGPPKRLPAGGPQGDQPETSHPKANLNSKYSEYSKPTNLNPTNPREILMFFFKWVRVKT